jgi:hypothetical protein
MDLSIGKPDPARTLPFHRYQFESARMAQTQLSNCTVNRKGQLSPRLVFIHPLLPKPTKTKSSPLLLKIMDITQASQLWEKKQLISWLNQTKGNLAGP